MNRKHPRRMRMGDMQAAAMEQQCNAKVRRRPEALNLTNQAATLGAATDNAKNRNDWNNYWRNQ